MSSILPIGGWRGLYDPFSNWRLDSNFPVGTTISGTTFVGPNDLPAWLFQRGSQRFNLAALMGSTFIPIVDGVVPSSFVPRLTLLGVG